MTTHEMPLGFCSISALDRPLAAAAELAAGLGLDGLEVTAHRPHLDPDEGVGAAQAAGRVVRAAGIDVIAYGSYLGRFGQVTAAHAEREAELAAALEAPLLRVWAEPLSDGQLEMGPTVALMQHACDAARRHGITVVIERHLGSFADTAARIAALLAAIDRPNVALNYQVLDFLPPDAVVRQAADAAELIRHARYFHLKNYQWNPDGQSAVLPGGSLADGILDYRAILAAAIGGGYRSPFAIEFLAADERPVEDKLAADVRFVRALLDARSSSGDSSPPRAGSR
jgi:sugar phosphate isomerase/epimerase